MVRSPSTKNFSHSLLCGVTGTPFNAITTFFKAEAIIYTGVNQKHSSDPSRFTPHDSRSSLQT